MLNNQFTRTIKSGVEQLLPGAALPTEEGQALVYVKGEDGQTYVKLSAGDAGEIFAGLVRGRPMPPALIPTVFRATVDSSAKVELPRAPKGQEWSVINVATKSAMDKATISLSGNVLTFQAGDKGKVVDVILMYVPTVEEARMYCGDMPFGGNPFAVGSVAAEKVGEYHTSSYVADADWTSALYVKLAAGGRFAPTANADEAIPGVIVKNSPNVSNAYLGLGINVA